MIYVKAVSRSCVCLKSFSALTALGIEPLKALAYLLSTDKKQPESHTEPPFR